MIIPSQIDARRKAFYHTNIWFIRWNSRENLVPSSHDKRRRVKQRNSIVTFFSFLRFAFGKAEREVGQAARNHSSCLNRDCEVLQHFDARLVAAATHTWLRNLIKKKFKFICFSEMEDFLVILKLKPNCFVVLNDFYVWNAWILRRATVDKKKSRRD